ncbi:MAG: aminopeptidase [Anaerolineales bacterium]|nr:MAG: aminopeptidase [Anaerolineales bacterium]
MPDQRVERLARLIVEYSMKVQPGERIAVAGTTLAEPIMLECLRQILKAGAHPQLMPSFPGQDFITFNEASDVQLEYTSPFLTTVVEEFDGFIQFSSTANSRQLSGINPERQGIRAKAMTPLMKRYMERHGTRDLRLLITMFPTAAQAQDAEMSLVELEDYVYASTYCDTDDPVGAWGKIFAQQQKLVDWLKGKETVVVKGPEVDLKLSIKGRDFVNAHGDINMPDGEVYTSPVEDSLEGWIRFSYPAIMRGQEVVGTELRFEAGKVVEARAQKGESMLLQMLDVDEGARYAGEFAIGTNKRINRFMRNILFDEKMGDTIHLALGAGFAEIGGKNESGIHWDMLCDMKDGGKIFVDDELFYDSGEFKIDS